MNLKEITASYTIHNKEDLIPSLISGLAENLSKQDEILFIFDNCTDNSFNLAFEEAKKKDLKIIALNFDSDLFETKANNEAIRWFMLESKKDILALFQDDIVLKDNEFKDKIATVIEEVPNLGLLGGRSGYDLKELTFPEKSINKYSNWEHLKQQYGKKLLVGEYQKVSFLNRGPIVFTRNLILEVGGLDESYYPQWADDLDYCARCKYLYNRQNVVFQCNVESKLEWGTMRKKPNPIIKRAIKVNWKRFTNKWGKYIENTP